MHRAELLVLVHLERRRPPMRRPLHLEHFRITDDVRMAPRKAELLQRVGMRRKHRDALLLIRLADLRLLNNRRQAHAYAR